MKASLDLGVQRARRREVVAERLLDDQPHPAVRRPPLRDLVQQRRDRARRHREVVDAVPERPALLVELRQRARRGRPRRVVGEVERRVVHPGRELVPRLLLERIAGVIDDRLLHRSRNSSSVSSVRAAPTMAKLSGSSRRYASAYSAGISFFARQVARRAEDHEHARVAGAAGGRAPRSSGFGSSMRSSGSFWRPSPRDRRTGCAAPRSPWRRTTRPAASAKRAKSAARDHRHRHVLGDRLRDRPAALARVLDVAADLLELGALLLEARRAAARAARSGRPSRSARCRRSRAGRGRTPTTSSPRSPRRRPASARTRSRCAPSSRSGPAPDGPTCA